MAKKLSLSDLTNDSRRPSWAVEVRQNYLRNKEQDENALARAQAAADQIKEAEGVVLPEAQIRDMARQYKETGDFSIEVPKPADFSGVTSSAETFPTPQEPLGFWDSRVAGLKQDLGQIGGVVDALQAGGYRDVAAIAERYGRSRQNSAENLRELGRPTAAYEQQSADFLLNTAVPYLRKGAEENTAASNSVLQPIIEKGGLEGILARTFQDAAQSGVSSSASLLGGPAGAVLGAGPSYANAYSEAKQAGLNDQDAETYALTQGGIEGAMSVIPAGKYLDRIPLVGAAIERATKRATGAIEERLLSPGIRAALKVGSTVVGEGVNEATTEVAQSLASAAAAGMAEQGANKDFLNKQADLDNLPERVERSALAGALMGGVVSTPIELRNSQSQFNAEVNDRANATTDAAVRNAQAVADRNATPAAPAPVPRRQTRAEVEQIEMFPETTPGPSSPIPEQEVQTAPTDSPLDDTRVAEQRRNTLRGLIENEQASIADLEARKEEAPLLREAGYDNFTANDEASLARSRERVQALQKELGRWEGGAVSQPVLPLTEPKQPKPQDEKPVQTRGGNTYYNPDGSRGSNTRDAARKEAEKAIQNQEKADAKAAETATRKARVAHNTERRKRLTELTTQARQMPADQRADFIADGIVEWDDSNPVPTEGTVAAAPATPAAPVTPVVNPTPEKPVAPPAKPGTVDATLEDITSKLALGMQEQTQTNAPAQASAFNPDDYKRKIRDVVGDLAAANTQQTVDAVNLINQGKLILAPSAESIGRPSTSDVAQYEPADGKMYLYTDKLNKGDTLGAVIRTYHEATHAGQFNDREGRPDVMQQMMGKGPAAKAQATVVRAAENGNVIARRAVDKARAASRGDAELENLEILPYFVGEVVAARGSTLGQLRGVANDILASAKKFVGKATGTQFDVSMRDLEKAVSGVGREIVQTEVTPSEGNTASMIYGETAADFENALNDGRVYTSTADGGRKFVLSDAGSTMTEGAVDLLNSTELSATDTIPLHQLMDHPTLYRNMPEARNIQVRNAIGRRDNEMGVYFPDSNLIEINPRVVNGNGKATLREILLHEVQHWVQDQNQGSDIFNTSPTPPAEQRAIRAYEQAKTANDQAGVVLMQNAGRIVNEMTGKTDKAIGRSIINSSRTPERKALDFGRLIADTETIIDDVEAKEAYNQFADTLNAYRKTVTPYNEAMRSAYQRYVTMPTEAEAFFTQRNADAPQDQLPTNPEMEDLEFGTAEGADVTRMAAAREARSTLGMADPTDVNPVAKRWAPAWLTGLVRADKGLSRVDNEIIEHAIASPAGYRMKAEAEMGKYDYAIDRLAAQQGKSKDALDKEIQKVIDGLPKDLNTHAENVAAFNAAMAPYGKAGDALKAMRDQVDELTLSILQQRADSGIPLTEADKKLYKTLVENMGKYTHRQYAAHAGELGNRYSTAVWKDYEKYKKGKGTENPTVKANYEKVADATKYLIDNNLAIPDDAELTKLGADQTRNLYNTWGKVGNPDGLSLDQMKEELALNRDLINGNTDALTSEAESIAKELLGLAPVNSPITTYYRGGKQDLGILKQRGAIAPVLRSLMGEIVDPSMRMVMTVAKQAEFVGRNRMLLELARSTEGDILPPGNARPTGWTKLEGQGYGPLEGYIASPNMVAAIGDVQQQLATFEQAVAMASRNPRELGTAMTNKALDAWGSVAGTSKMLQVIWSPMNFVYNLAGGPLTMLTNGNVNPVSFGKGAKAAYDLVSYAVNPKAASEVATRLVKNDVVDSAFVGEIKNEQYRELRKVVMEMAGRGNPKLENVGEMLHKARAGFKETYAMMDVMYKVANFYQQVDTLTDFYKKNGDVRTAEQIDREASDIVKRTNFTYRRVAPMLKAIESKGFSAFGPYMHEVFRTQIAGVFQGIGEIQRAGEAKTPEARNVMLLQGTKRLTGTAAAWGLIGTASSLLSGITFGEDDDENEAKRALLPEYLQDQDFVEIGKDAKGNPVLFNVSRFDPIGPATDLMRGILQGGIEPDKLSKKMLDLYVVPRIGPQVATAVGTTFDAKVRVNRVPLVQELAPEQYSTLLDVAKQVGIPARIAKAWTNVGETLYPGIANSWRSTNARPTSPDDLVTSVYNTSTYLGMQLQSVDPAKPVRFAAMSYSDSVKQGRSELVEMFKDNPNRTAEQVVSQILTSRSNERQAYDELRKTYQGARAVGVPQRDLMAQMKLLKLNGEQIRAITTGNFASGVVSLPSLATYEKRELQDAPRSEHREIRNKWKDIRDLLQSASRQVNESED